MSDIKINGDPKDQSIINQANVQWITERIKAGETDGSLTSDEKNVLNDELTQATTGTDPIATSQKLSEISDEVFEFRNNDLGQNLKEGSVLPLIDSQNYLFHPALNNSAPAGIEAAPNSSNLFPGDSTSFGSFTPPNFDSLGSFTTPNFNVDLNNLINNGQDLLNQKANLGQNDFFRNILTGLNFGLNLFG